MNPSLPVLWFYPQRHVHKTFRRRFSLPLKYSPLAAAAKPVPLPKRLPCLSIKLQRTICWVWTWEYLNHAHYLPVCKNSRLRRKSPLWFSRLLWPAGWYRTRLLLALPTSSSASTSRYKFTRAWVKPKSSEGFCSTFCCEFFEGTHSYQTFFEFDFCIHVWKILFATKISSTASPLWNH